MKNYNLKFKTFYFLIVVFTFSFLLFNFAQAAVLYLEPAEGEYRQGDTFIVNARIDPEGECVNTIQADLTFPGNILEAKDFSSGNSIISVWLKMPEFSNEIGSVAFAGGMPGGFCGILPGDPGESNLLGRIVFQAKESGRGLSSPKVEFLDSSRVLLNDGQGTPAKLTLKGSTIKVTGVAPLQIPRDEWQEELEKDKIPPEPFEIEINQEPSTFEGKYFIAFHTQDKQTGIDHYEVKEGKREWRIGEAPYLLEDQEIKGIIKVKAVDKAGNERIAEYKPPRPFPYWIIIAVLIAGGIIGWTIKKLKTKK